MKATQLDVIIEKLDGSLHQTNVARIKYKAQQRQHDNFVQMQKKAHEKLEQFRSMEPLKVNLKFSNFSWTFLHLKTFNWMHLERNTPI